MIENEEFLFHKIWPLQFAFKLNLLEIFNLVDYFNTGPFGCSFLLTTHKITNQMVFVSHISRKTEGKLLLAKEIECSFLLVIKKAICWDYPHHKTYT